MSRGNARAIRNGCQLNSLPVSLVVELICIASTQSLDRRLLEQ